ncbi:MAG: hypothetical protein EBU01_11585 [Crocinitomicaceae bacterium]|nr:hypothetical protein [Crocinitomicaceae bacterium]NCA22577.1 hypothetical protein [Crocinitomicaceae bacterium]
MSYIKKTNTIERVDIEALFEKEKKRNEEKIKIFNGILNKIYSKIKEQSKIGNSRCIQFALPSSQFNNVKDVNDCKLYIQKDLTENKFTIRWKSPIVAIISWGEYVPQYMRDFFYQTQGIKMNERGEILPTDEEIKREEERKEMEELAMQGIKKKENKFKPVEQYVPTGVFYSNEILQKLQERINNT